ncbi:MAG: S1 RNA-binding domain-containing protein [Planctomycetes bacterium]|nr:S1 RNA-binding domain-containing protein [Planctomycetota bacterium]
MSETVPSLDAVVSGVIAERWQMQPGVVARALELIRANHPIPYLARYRRDDVGGLDEGTLRDLRDEAEGVRELETRREFIVRGLRGRDDVPEKAIRRIEKARSRVELEYLYEPFRPPRKTPGAVARERGLEPLAEACLRNEPPDPQPFVTPEMTAEEALLGAREILAERFAVDPEVRGAMFRAAEKEGVVGAIPAHGKAEIPERFANLRTYEEKLSRVPSHRFLALRRAEKEGAITIKVAIPEEKVLAAVAQRFYPKEPAEPVKGFLDQAAAEAVRLMRPAVLDDALREAKDRADREAITVFQRNLRDLLLFPPAGPGRVLGVDPAPRGMIPLACVDERGETLDHARLKFHDKDEAKVQASRERILALVQTHGIRLVAIGNGQGRRECEAFLAETLAALGDKAPPVVVVNEVGVGSYASGPVGRAELPSLPVPVRAAVSLARRLMDPLPELVKVDPRHIGVGQYQNDVDEKHLDAALKEVVTACVNHVGVDVNRAPAQQLAYVCGLSTYVARSIVHHREKHGRFPNRAAIRALPFVTPHAFELAGGFLRVRGGDDPLDATGVHPDHAPVAARIAERLKRPAAELIGNADLLSGIDVEEIADAQFSAATVAGVLVELIQGDADPRPPLEIARRGVARAAGELKAGMRLEGRVTNVTNFGAFVDVGVNQDGLVHVSELADHFVKDPTSVVRVGQVVNVRVLGVEEGRISLSMKSGERPRREGGERRERGDRGDRGSRRPRRPRREEREVSAAPEPPPPPPPEREAAPEEAPENPVPADMTEEEFMKRKLEELRRRFS